MRKKQISIELDSVWVLGQRGEDALPMDKCIDAMKAEFPDGFTVLSVGLVGCKAVIDVPDERAADIGARLAALLKKTFGVSDVFSIATLTVDDVSVPKPKIRPKVPATDTVERSAEQAGADERSGAEDVLKRIDGLFGCDEFKQLAHELFCIAPQVKKYKTIKTFLFQNYLFSINEGYGLTTYLELFA